MAELSLQTLPPEIRHQIWSYLVQPTTVYPCECAARNQQCQFHHQGACCRNNSTYQHCDNRILVASRQIFSEVAPLAHQAGQKRTFVLCNNQCLDNFFQALDQRDWKWVRHMQVELFVGWSNDGQDDWFLHQMHSWARRYIMGTLFKFEEGRKVTIEPAGEAKEDRYGRRTLAVDIYLD